uniref:EGF-like domain-containing protein n=1 Tax=Eptatretus burgeri TaxID=7764 RepID=A0A8C4R1F2_EPTBU
MTTSMPGSYFASCTLVHRNFCLNGGACLHFTQLNAFSCSCPAGFEGERCELATLEWWQLEEEQGFRRHGSGFVAALIMAAILLLSAVAATLRCWRRAKYRFQMVSHASDSYSNLSFRSRSSSSSGSGDSSGGTIGRKLRSSMHQCFE